ncbi:serine-type D-Ala-D-Ala carboxypeptidase [Vibrio gallaecicus]|uniref:Serine-type D-Ala-D-Ala carboxypeptidase n=1 Tax=Vibrio gallaecicus TaxID=552386 RepID=A0ABV4N825_9VIBR
MRILTALIFFSFSFSVFAYTPLNYLPKGSVSSLIVESLDSSEEFISLNSDRFYPPASTLKLVTALAAKLELGNDFHYSTSLYKSGSDVVISFSGDPTLKREHLKQLLRDYKKKYGNQIDGSIFLDNSAFTGYDRAVGWPWDILGVCYSAPASAITLDENCAQASIYTQDDGHTRVYIPAHYPITVNTETSTVSRSGQKATQCSLELTTTPDNEYQLSGCLIERKKPLPLKFAIQNPELYVQNVTSDLVAELKMDIKGQITVKSTSSSKMTLVSKHRSPSLPSLLNTMLKESDNLIADNLTKTLGATFFVQAGSFNNGTEAIKQILLSKAGIDLQSAKLTDGSGLSRNNRMTAESMTQVLHYIWENEKELNLLQSMPKSGLSGTLRYRKSMRKAPIEGNIIAKSGSLYGSYNMAGFGLDKAGQPNSVFVQFVRDYYPVKNNTDTPVIAPITQFEKAFYKDVIKFSQQ